MNLSFRTYSGIYDIQTSLFQRSPDINTEYKNNRESSYYLFVQTAHQATHDLWKHQPNSLKIIFTAGSACLGTEQNAAVIGNAK